MAIWQFDIDLIAPDGQQLIPCELAPTLLRELEQRLGRTKRILPGWDYFGLQNSNRVDVFVDENGALEAQARLDARANSTDAFIARICTATAIAGCRFFCGELGEALDPTALRVKEILQRSRAWRYAVDPESVDP